MALIRQCHFIRCNKYTTLLGAVNYKGVYALCGGKGYMEKSLYLPLSFCCESKSAVRNFFFFFFKFSSGCVGIREQPLSLGVQ